MVASTPRVLGLFEADDRGAITGDVYLPVDLDAGTHDLAAYGLGSHIGLRQEFQLGPIGTESGPLPFTGADSQRTIGLGIALLAAGMSLTLAVRLRERRRRRA